MDPGHHTRWDHRHVRSRTGLSPPLPGARERHREDGEDQQEEVGLPVTFRRLPELIHPGLLLGGADDTHRSG